MNIHLYSKNDYVSLLNKIKTYLKNAGFEDIQMVYENWEKDTELFHVTISADYNYMNINN